MEIVFSHFQTVIESFKTISSFFLKLLGEKRLVKSVKFLTLRIK